MLMRQSTDLFVRVFVFGWGAWEPCEVARVLVVTQGTFDRYP
jgi:hypothetical protein